ncbi:SMYD3 [Symbiodinium natans]|uniref:SMYD3 protein n=1 Tax=Symbiodinium natans TaxID=878477 RepID=A0A812SZU3_9DINO|nr:SMYD3 [Symbiodinium natans]
MELLSLVLGMCGDATDTEARALARQRGRADRKLFERIVRHNHYEVEAAPRDGESQEDFPECGLWPLAAVVNHSLHPNVTRSFLGHQVFLRLVRDVAAGEELVDNYLDPRLPHEERVAFLGSVHGVDDEGPDEFDADEEQFASIQERLHAAKCSVEAEVFPEAERALESATQLCRTSGVLDPAFTDVFWALADLAARSGNAMTRQDRLNDALRYATAREPHSTVSCQLAVCRAHAMAEARSQGSATVQELRQAESAARRHFRGVYGPDAGIFEHLNPELVDSLRSLLPPAAPDRGPGVKHQIYERIARRHCMGLHWVLTSENCQEISPDLYMSVKVFAAFSIAFNVFVYLNTAGPSRKSNLRVEFPAGGAKLRLTAAC